MYIIVLYHQHQHQSSPTTTTTISSLNRPLWTKILWKPLDYSIFIIILMFFFLNMSVFLLIHHCKDVFFRPLTHIFCIPPHPYSNAHDPVSNASKCCLDSLYPIFFNIPFLLNISNPAMFTSSLYLSFFHFFSRYAITLDCKSNFFFFHPSAPFLKAY